MNRQIRHIILSTLLLLCLTPTLSSAGELKKQWKEYQRIARHDRPKDQIRKLHEIRELALAKRYPEDLLEACRREFSVYTRMNWKSRDSVSMALLEVVESYDVPLLTYRWLSSSWQYAKLYKDELSAGHHPELQGVNKHLWLIGQEKSAISDFEWILWDQLTQKPKLIPSSEQCRMLSELLGDRYPAAPYLAYLVACNSPDSVSTIRMQALYEKFADDPFRFFPWQEILQSKFSEMQRNPSTTEAQYRELYDEVETFLRELKSESGVCERCSFNDVNSIRSTLTRSTMSVTFLNDSIIVTGRNLERCKLVFESYYDKKTVSLRNHDGRFYLLDTIKAPVPLLKDGEYSVHGKDSYYPYADYDKTSLSVAVRKQGDKIAVYIADHATGEPVPTAKLTLRNLRSKVIAECELQLDGFTLLPDSFQKRLGKHSVYLEAQYGEMRSQRISLRLNDSSEEKDNQKTTVHGRIFKDRGAYHPGDTLKAKAVLFRVSPSNRMSSLKSGEDVKVSILNAEGKIVNKLSLQTNGYGSAAFSWPIPRDERNGRFLIKVSYRGDEIVNSVFRVDDFVLPTYDLTFDPQEVPFCSDTDFEIKGRISSFSGHPVDGVRLTGIVRKSISKNSNVWSGSVSVGMDGAFCLPLNLPDGDYELVLTSVDGTGETQQFTHEFNVSKNLSLSVKLDNAAPGGYTLCGSYRELPLISGSRACFSWDLKSGKTPLSQSVAYLLSDGEGKVLRKGNSSEMLELDMSAYPDGLYFLYGSFHSGKHGVETRFSFLKWTDSNVMSAPVRSAFLPGELDVVSGGRIKARLGAGKGPLWAVVSLYSTVDGSVLQSGMICLDAEYDTVSEIDFNYEDSYPDAVRLEVFYFRDSESVTHEAVFRRSRQELCAPLSITGFVDRTMPGATCKISLKTDPGMEAVVAVFDKSLDSFAPNNWDNVCAEEPRMFRPLFFAKPGKITGERLRNMPDGPVFGVVVDTEGNPIIGAAISVTGTSIGTIADLNGHFQLNVASGTALLITCIGYVSAPVYASSNMYVVLEEDYNALSEVVVVGYGTSVKRSFTGAVQGVRIRGASTVKGTSAKKSLQDEPAAEEAPNGNIRALFSESLAFEPFLYSDDQGRLDVTFKSSDKVSTYHVNVFTHDSDMKNAYVQRDFIVTIPVRVAVNPPRYLYAGDSYVLSAVVSSLSDEAIPGHLYLQVESGGQKMPLQKVDITVPAEGSVHTDFPLSLPSSEQSDSLSVLLIFESEYFSDAVSYIIPVSHASQTITECHSAIAGIEAADSLRSMFVNIPGEQAKVSIKTFRDVVEEGLEQWNCSEDPDALSLSARFCAKALLGQDTTGVLKSLMALRSEDGGFAWVDGMESSPVVTAVILERFAVLRDRGIQLPDMQSTVHYLDCSQFGELFPFWMGGLSDQQYMDIRSMWASVPIDLKDVEEKVVRRIRLRDFRSFARYYLTPGRYDYAHGWVLDKARRVHTLQNLISSEGGIALAQFWGEQVFTASRFKKSISNDLLSLEQYAVRHPSGGLYFPNAILPFRGMLSSEVYAHNLLSKLLEGSVSDGIRLWLILQNETQSWTGDPVYLDVLQNLLDSPESLLDRNIITLSASAVLPFEKINPSGNGMSIERKFYLAGEADPVELHAGDSLHVGDRIIANYRLWSAENRSLVKVESFRESCFVPVDQKSGPYRSFATYLRAQGLLSRMPQAYRDIRHDKTIWWIDACPEEKTSLKEEFFVTQSGVFTAPVITVECQAAPDYRANDGYRGPVISRD